MGKEKDISGKYEALKAEIASMGSVLVAFSGGVDSALLLYAAREALGDRAEAATAVAPWFPSWEKAEAEEFCGRLGVPFLTVPVQMETIDQFTENPPDRCYHCKKALMTRLRALAKERGLAEVLEGSNADDMGDYRPGFRAVKELGLKSPLLAAGLAKAEIRALSRRFGLPTAEKPAFACLASRIPYGETITKEKLAMVDAAEQFLLDRGFAQMRVRVHGGMARIELLPEDIPRLMDEALRKEVSEKFRAIGFSYTALDLRGYRMGSLNETLK